MIAEFQKSWEEEYEIKKSEQLQSVIHKRNTHTENNAQTQRDRNTTTDMDEVRADGDEDDKTGYSEDDPLRVLHITSSSITQTMKKVTNLDGNPGTTVVPGYLFYLLNIFLTGVNFF
jgi:hypothetical protein